MGLQFRSQFTSEQIELAISKILNQEIGWDDLDSAFRDQLEQEIDKRVSELLVFTTYADFPEIGDPSVLYIAKDRQTLYFWDESQYIPLGGSSMSKIDLIDCGGAQI